MKLLDAVEKYKPEKMILNFGVFSTTWIKEEVFIEKANEKARYFNLKIKEKFLSHKNVGEVRSIGLINAIELVKILMAYHKFDTSKVKRHYDWTKKHCPAWLQEGKWGYTWSWFKKQLTAKTETKKEETFKSYVVKILVDELNIRKEANFDSAVVGVVKKGQAFTIVEEKNGLGKLKSGAGWISLGSKYVQKV